jgi:hypothetical protein
MLSDVQRQWAALKTGGVAGAADFSPAVAQAARVKLLQGARDFITNSLLDASGSSVRDITGRQGLILNKVSDFIENNLGWIKSSGLFNQDQIDVWKAIRDSAVKGARIDNLRGGKGSQTYGLLMKDPRWIDILAPAWTRGAATLAGGVIGATMGAWEAGIGALLGAEAEGWGRKALNKFYGAPTELLRQKLNEAINDPDLAQFLMSKASAPPSGLARGKAQAWLRSIVAQQPVAQTQRIESRQPDTTAPQLLAPAGP